MEKMEHSKTIKRNNERPQTINIFAVCALDPIANANMSTCVSGSFSRQKQQDEWVKWRVGWPKLQPCGTSLTHSYFFHFNEILQKQNCMNTKQRKGMNLYLHIERQNPVQMMLARQFLRDVRSMQFLLMIVLMLIKTLSLLLLKATLALA